MQDAQDGVQHDQVLYSHHLWQFFVCGGVWVEYNVRWSNVRWSRMCGGVDLVVDLVVPMDPSVPKLEDVFRRIPTCEKRAIQVQFTGLR